jgi:hypothetical protein
VGPQTYWQKDIFLAFLRLTKIDPHFMKIYFQPNGKTLFPIIEG